MNYFKEVTKIVQAERKVKFQRVNVAEKLLFYYWVRLRCGELGVLRELGVLKELGVLRALPEKIILPPSWNRSFSSLYGP